MTKIDLWNHPYKTSAFFPDILNPPSPFPPCRHFFTSLRRKISRNFDPSPLQIADVSYGRSLLSFEFVGCARPPNFDAKWICSTMNQHGKKYWPPDNPSKVNGFFFAHTKKT